jgi:hypothetical protein
MTMRDRPEVVLARHFFTSLFDFGFLSDDGAEALKRVLLGSLAVALALGMLLVRVFMAKYGSLSDGPLEEYERALVADHAFLIAVPMWFVAAAMGLVGQSLFPDETDFRILMAEPLSRSVIFGAKLAALLLFGALFVAGTHLALLPLAVVTMIGTFRTGTFLATALAFAFSSALASLFAALASSRCRSSRGCRARNARSRRADGGFRWRHRRGSWGWNGGCSGTSAAPRWRLKRRSAQPPC